MSRSDIITNTILPSDRVNHIVTLLEAERATNWSLGDEYAQCVREFGKGIIGELAGIARCSSEHVKQCIRVALAFPHEYRHPDIDWSWYRALRQAADRGKRDPLELLQECIKPKGNTYESSLSMAELRMLYRDAESKPPVLRFAARCDGCGSRVIVYCPAELRGAVFECPVCAATKGEMRFLGKVE